LYNIQNENTFWLITILTIIITRISIALIPRADIKISNIIIHHFWFGVIFIFLTYFLPKKIKIFFLGIGSGLFLDQLVFMALGAWKDKVYWNILSLGGTILLSILLYPLRKRILRLFIPINGR